MKWIQARKSQIRGVSRGYLTDSGGISGLSHRFGGISGLSHRFGGYLGGISQIRGVSRVNASKQTAKTRGEYLFSFKSRFRSANARDLNYSLRPLTLAAVSPISSGARAAAAPLSPPVGDSAPPEWCHSSRSAPAWRCCLPSRASSSPCFTPATLSKPQGPAKRTRGVKRGRRRSGTSNSPVGAPASHAAPPPPTAV